MKFKIGDKVRANENYANGALVRTEHTGVITDIAPENPRDAYRVVMDHDGDFWYFGDDDLTLVKSSAASDALVLKVRRLHPDAVMPKYARPGDAAFDLTATEVFMNTSFQIGYRIGLAFEIPEGHVGLIYPRSSICRYELTLSNSTGVIDSGYRGEVAAIFNKTDGIDSRRYVIGERIAQMIIMPIPAVTIIETEDLSETERGTGGFGSSGA